MNKISHSIIIKARPEVVWETVIDPIKYMKWTYVFSEGSYFEGGWNEGDSIHFLTKSEGEGLAGMVGEIAEVRYPEFISIRQIGFVSNGVVDTTSDSVKEWAPAYENYTLDLIDEHHTKFTVDVETQEEYTEMFDDVWPKALELLKDISEDSHIKPMKITIKTTIPKPLKSVWEGFTNDDHITKWNFASDEWHCPKAVNNLKEGDIFDYIMASKDGKASFHFQGKYTKIVPHKQISYVMDDDREVDIYFNEKDGVVYIEETFEAENTHSYIEQRQGWQAILDNFGNYVKENF